MAVLACSSNSSPTLPTGSSVAGTWTLQSINGLNLPYVTAQTGANKIEITSEVLTVVATGSFTEITTLRYTVSGQVSAQSVADAGSYALNGTAVIFQFNSDGSIGTGSLSGKTLTVANAGNSFVFKKQ